MLWASSSEWWSIMGTPIPIGRFPNEKGSVSILLISLTTAAILFLPMAVTQFADVAVAVIAAVASVVNTVILSKARKTQYSIRDEIRKMNNPVETLRELSEEREHQIDELRGLNRAFSNRAIELRQLVEESNGR